MMLSSWSPSRPDLSHIDNPWPYSNKSWLFLPPLQDAEASVQDSNCTSDSNAHTTSDRITTSKLWGDGMNHLCFEPNRASAKLVSSAFCTNGGGPRSYTPGKWVWENYYVKNWNCHSENLS
jgi:hypothetical protein